MNTKIKKDNQEMIRYEKTAENNYSNVNQGMGFRKYYKIKTQTNFDLNDDSKFMNYLFW